MQCIVGKQFDFPAAHRNASHPGHCSNVHGHTWTMEIIIRGRVQTEDGPEKGMVLDFGRIKDAYAQAIEPYVEHQMLNDTLDLPEYTTEHLAAWAFIELSRVLPRLHAVKVWEGRTSYALVQNGDQLHT